MADTARLAAASHLALQHVGELVGRQLRRNGDLNLNDDFDQEALASSAQLLIPAG